MFFKTKICRNKLYIYPEVEARVAKQSPTELIELGFVVLETSHLLLRMMDTRKYKKDMRFWVKRISHNADVLPELLWREGKRSNQLVIRNQNNEQLQLLRYRISRTIQTLFSFEEDDRAPFKINQIHEYFGKWDWAKK
ncbi:hypothetical protein JSQ81_13910 [Sporosarcina sp. Marseille-Q4063]|uniref:hypothetical protein n=1 Tax=Sporosarcina sp. Marseille-Q4063 TaxID=2810514 RepID=UPI001BAE59EC|nr:hypothetical protein [Sporosarcina sp. Marseille-Q4063]QUW20907.1 hypothetical protein JSQ81_13910 [Sporosarcina sp. Marseille-Q4063]